MAIDARRQPAIARQFRTLFGAGSASGLTDGELLGRFAARRGDSSELAFAALLERHGGMVWGICRRVLDDPRDVEDAFQATFLVLVRRARSVRVSDSLGRWLYGVARRARNRSSSSASDSPATTPELNNVRSRRRRSDDPSCDMDPPGERSMELYPYHSASR